MSESTGSLSGSILHFLRWWRGQLVDSLPASWRPRRETTPLDALLLRADSSGFVPLLRKDGRMTPVTLSAGVARDLPVIVEPDPAWLLVREVWLPQAAAGHLSELLANELNRLTPFNPTQVWWRHQLLASDTARGQIRVRLTLLPHARLAGLDGMLAAAGLTLWAIQAPAFEICLRRLPLSPARLRARHLLLLGAGLALASLMVPVLHQQIILMQLASRSQAASGEAERANQLRRTLFGDASDPARIAAARGALALRLLEGLTRELPDDTWLASLQWQGSQLSIEGSSGDAVKLIAPLAADPLLHDAGFAAPVVKRTDGRDNFTINAAVNPLD